MADRRNKSKCRECNQLKRDLRSIKQRNKDLRAENDELRAVVDAGAEYLKLLVAYVDG
jgi:regulator of replication initiation timing